MPCEVSDRLEQVSRHTKCFNPCPPEQMTCRSSTPKHKAIPQPTYISHTDIHNSNSCIHLHTVSFSHTAKTRRDSLSLLVLHTGTQLAARWRVEQFFTQDLPVMTRISITFMSVYLLHRVWRSSVNLHVHVALRFFSLFSVDDKRRPDSRRVPNSHPSDEVHK